MAGLSLYHNHISNSYFIIIQKGIAWNIVYEYGKFTTRFMKNEDLEQMITMELNSENIKILFESNVNFKNIDYSNFAIDRYFIYNNYRYNIKSWNDVFDFALMVKL